MTMVSVAGAPRVTPTVTDRSRQHLIEEEGAGGDGMGWEDAPDERVLLVAVSEEISSGSFSTRAPSGLSQNSLSRNSVTQNGLTQNGLTQNGLTQNGLTQNG